MVEVLKKESYPFDAETARVEAKNAEMLFTLHLKRCDSAETASFMAETFNRLAEKFKQKTLALKSKL